MAHRLFGVAAAALMLAACSSTPASGSAQLSPDASLFGHTLDGSDVSLADLRGHPVVLVFWASRCAPCAADQPQLNTAYAVWSKRGVHFLGVDMLDDDSAARTFVRAHSVGYPNVVDPHAAIAEGFLISSAPALAFVDSSGQVVDRVLGGLESMSSAEFDQQLTRLVH